MVFGYQNFDIDTGLKLIFSLDSIYQTGQKRERESEKLI